MGKIKQLIQRVKEYVLTHLPSKETIIRSAKKALHAGLMGMISAFAAMPINLENPKKYLLSLVVGLGTGFLVGIQKLISGYVKYDLNK